MPQDHEDSVQEDAQLETTATETQPSEQSGDEGSPQGTQPDTSTQAEGQVDPRVSAAQAKMHEEIALRAEAERKLAVKEAEAEQWAKYYETQAQEPVDYDKLKEEWADDPSKGVEYALSISQQLHQTYEQRDQQLRDEFKKELETLRPERQQYAQELEELNSKPWAAGMNLDQKVAFIKENSKTVKGPNAQAPSISAAGTTRTPTPTEKPDLTKKFESQLRQSGALKGEAKAGTFSITSESSEVIR